MFTTAGVKKGLARAKQLANQNLGRAERTELSVDIQLLEKRVDAVKSVCKTLTSKLHTTIPGVGIQDHEKRKKKMAETSLAGALHECSLHSGDELLKSMFNSLAVGQMELSEHLCLYGEQVENQSISYMHTLLEEEIPKIKDLKKKLEKQTLDADAARSKLTEAVKRGSQRTETIKEELAELSQRMEQTRDQYTGEMYMFLTKETELAERLIHWVKAQVNYHTLALQTLEELVPDLQADMSRMAVKSVFECSLEEHLQEDGREIAVVIEACISLLAEHAMDEEGLFRIAGGASRLKSLKAAFNKGAIVMEEYLSDIHAVAGTLKSYLRELPEPLMSFDLYEEWIEAAQMKEHDSKMKTLWTIVDRLPKPNADNLRYLIKFMAKLADNSAVNKMTAGNIAIVLGPNLLWARDREGPNVVTTSLQSSVVELLIRHHDYFFPGGETNFPIADLTCSPSRNRLSAPSTGSPHPPSAVLRASSAAFIQSPAGGAALANSTPTRPAMPTYGASPGGATGSKPSGVLSPTSKKLSTVAEGKHNGQAWTGSLAHAAGTGSTTTNYSTSSNYDTSAAVLLRPPPRRTFGQSIAPPPPRMHGDVYDTAFALLTLSGGGGANTSSSSANGKGGDSGSLSGGGASSTSLTSKGGDYLARVHDIWDNTDNMGASMTMGKATSGAAAAAASAEETELDCSKKMDVDLAGSVTFRSTLPRRKHTEDDNKLKRQIRGLGINSPAAIVDDRDIEFNYNSRTEAYSSGAEDHNGSPQAIGGVEGYSESALGGVEGYSESSGSPPMGRNVTEAKYPAGDFKSTSTGNLLEPSGFCPSTQGQPSPTGDSPQHTRRPLRKKPPAPAPPRRDGHVRAHSDVSLQFSSSTPKPLSTAPGTSIGADAQMLSLQPHHQPVGARPSVPPPSRPLGPPPPAPATIHQQNVQQRPQEQQPPFWAAGITSLAVATSGIGSSQSHGSVSGNRDDLGPPPVPPPTNQSADTSTGPLSGSEDYRHSFDLSSFRQLDSGPNDGVLQPIPITGSVLQPSHDAVQPHNNPLGAASSFNDPPFRQDSMGVAISRSRDGSLVGDSSRSSEEMMGRAISRSREGSSNSGGGGGNLSRKASLGSAPHSRNQSFTGTGSGMFDFSREGEVRGESHDMTVSMDERTVSMDERTVSMDGDGGVAGSQSNFHQRSNSQSKETFL